MTLGTRYRPAATCGALRWYLLVLVGFGDYVGPQALHLAGERMRHRLDARRVGRVELLDEVDDPRQAVRRRRASRASVISSRARCAMPSICVRA